MKFISCAHRPREIFRHGKISYLASDQDSVPFFKGDLVINFTKYSNLYSVSSIPELRQHLEHSFQEIQIPWPDFDTPKVKITFWSALHKYISAKRKFKTVLFHCGAGHGRTGTALCSMLIALKKMDAESAINMVRDLHCKHAVETEEQVDYLFNLDFALNKREPIVEHSIIPSIYMSSIKSQEDDEITNELVDLLDNDDIPDLWRA